MDLHQIVQMLTGQGTEKQHLASDYAKWPSMLDKELIKVFLAKVAPYNTFYSQLEEHMTEVGIDATINRWHEPLALGVIDPHDSLSHPAGVADAQTESAACLDPDQFTNFLIPNWFEGEPIKSTRNNPFPLPDLYFTSQQRNKKNLGEIQKILREAPLEENRKRELSCALHVYFKDWLYASGNIRQLYCLLGD